MKTLEEIEICTYFKCMISDKLKKNRLTIGIFIIFGLLLAFYEFDFDKESYNSLFSTMATIALALIGFTGIFLVLLLETNRDSILDYVADIDRLKKDKLEIYNYIPITKSSNIENINNVLKYIQTTIDLLNHEIASSTTNSDIFKIKVKERNTLQEIKSILENLKLERNKLRDYVSRSKDTFLFAIFSILLFMIPLAFNHVNYSNDSYSMGFNNWRYVKMSFAGFFFGLFFIILQDSALILKDTFDRLDILKYYPDGGLSK